MKTKAEIINDLPSFTGTETWYRYSPLFPKVLLTEGAKYIAEACDAYWLMDMIASHLSSVKDSFAIAQLFRTNDYGRSDAATFYLVDDVPPETTWAKQEIEYTDFPLDEIKFYVSWDGENWTILLTSEY